MTRAYPSVGALLLVFTATLAGCAAPPVPLEPPAATPATSVATGAATPALESGELTVFAASSLTDAFEAIGAAFERAYPGSKVDFNFAGSRTLRTQIEEGAAADVFASANADELEALAASGRVALGAGRVFAWNRLVVIVAPDNPALLLSLGDLTKPGVKVVLVAEEVPAGKYARQALDNLDRVLGEPFSDGVLANVVSLEDNVRQVVAKVALGEADAGIVYATDAASEPRLGTIAIDDAYNVRAAYPLATVSNSARPALAQAFVDYVLSASGQRILRSYGFLPAEGD